LKDLVFGFFDTFFATTEFAAGIKRCFQRTGTGLKVGGVGFEEFYEEIIERNLQVVPSDTLDEAYDEFGELATEFPTIIDEETQQEILVDAIIRHLIGVLKAMYALLQLTSIRLQKKLNWKRR
jgi:hypothetical protein